MPNATVTYRELRFLIEDELTQVFVRVDVGGDAPIGVQGWHHKTFPVSQPVDGILAAMFGQQDDPILWAQLAPPTL